MYIISKCLIGINCKYNGGNNKNDDVIKFCEEKSFIGICPECDAGLGTPRIPSEISLALSTDKKKRVVNKEGKDLTKEFILGSKISYDKALESARKANQRIEGAILKSKSPSCGVGMIYDGTFTGTLTEGNGIFADLLIDKSIPVYTEKNFKNFIIYK